jgi:hypothetical protein
MSRRWNGYRPTGPHADYPIVSERLTEAFKILRSQGIIARKNYMCCQTCAGYAIATKVSDMPAEKRVKVNGTVFYHAQDASGFRQSGTVYLAFGCLETEKYGTIGLPTVEVGKMVVEALKDVGLAYEWDGTEDTRIVAKMP